jgi:hypothetical protein
MFVMYVQFYIQVLFCASSYTKSGTFKIPHEVLIIAIVLHYPVLILHAMPSC